MDVDILNSTVSEKLEQIASSNYFYVNLNKECLLLYFWYPIRSSAAILRLHNILSQELTNSYISQ
jgi:hypothetical protein